MIDCFFLALQQPRTKRLNNIQTKAWGCYATHSAWRY